MSVQNLSAKASMGVPFRPWVPLTGSNPTRTNHSPADTGPDARESASARAIVPCRYDPSSARTASQLSEPRGQVEPQDPQKNQDHLLLFAVDSVLSHAECQFLIKFAEEIGFEQAALSGGVDKRVRNSGTCHVLAKHFAEEIFQRLVGNGRPQTDQKLLPEVIVDAYGNEWKLSGLYSRLSLLRYRGSEQKFMPHVDGVVRGVWQDQEGAEDDDGDSVLVAGDKHKEPKEDPKSEDGVPKPQRPSSPRLFQTFLTAQLYLNDVPEAAGGATRFFANRAVMRDPIVSAERDSHVFAQVQPRTGRVAVFDHNWVHDGQAVNGGEAEKYTCRFDVLYELSDVAPARPVAVVTNVWQRFEAAPTGRSLLNSSNLLSLSQAAPGSGGDVTDVLSWLQPIAIGIDVDVGGVNTNSAATTRCATVIDAVGGARPVLTHLSPTRSDLHDKTRDIMGHKVRTSYRPRIKSANSVQAYRERMRWTFAVRRFLVLAVCVAVVGALARWVIGSDQF